MFYATRLDMDKVEFQLVCQFHRFSRLSHCRQFTLSLATLKSGKALACGLFSGGKYISPMFNQSHSRLH
jgi:hypothetical protein